ncbi:hypothetical protein MTsPCn5_05360 [Croceitalea sp. MTPC5]|uniref:NAD(P)/FAD-dependent oxidoreductase n=1 Tax=Croceitalea sp. MTPC5 TaxID=3056565 RepID=UPI002B3FB626|nr:hypothetical protein MTsPCn5_05360 [Croceitalea sp. MTPC5]
MNHEVVIIGGGLAGLTAAIHLAKYDKKVLVIEKNHYPNHKVCGEYVSNEVRPYLNYLGVAIEQHTTVAIDTLEISTRTGKSIKTKLPLGGFGISRYALDELLYKKALEHKVSFLFDTVTNVDFHTDRFEIETTQNGNFESGYVLGAYGKRSLLDKKLERKFIAHKSPWLGVKCHYDAKDFPDNLVALHNFDGGYGGLSKTETGAINFCYLTTFESFRKFPDISGFNKMVVGENPLLAEFLENAEPLFKKPLSIAQISFEPKEPVEKHVLMCGDSAGLIHPLCGNGMAMAIHSGKIAAEQILQHESTVKSTRADLEKSYTIQWKRQFDHRLWMGRQLQRLLMNSTSANIAMNTVARSEKILRSMIRRTHGKPILV